MAPGEAPTNSPDRRAVDAGALRRFIADSLGAVGLPDTDAATVAELMVTADLRGSDGHGVFRLPQYIRRIRAGGINVTPEIMEAKRSRGVALVDGDNGMGHLVVKFAAERAMELAAEHGVSWVGIRNGNHAGPGGLYAMMPLERDQIGIYVAIGNANHLAPWGGIDRLLSTNPIAIAVPGREHGPIVLDMATSAVSYGTIKRYAKRGEPMPVGWMIDERGEPLLDPTRADDGIVLPAAGYKGYGLSLMIALLAGALTGAATGSAVVDFNHDDTTPTNTGQAIAALDIGRLADVDEFKHRVDALVDEIKASRKLPDVEVIRLPGERAQASFEERRRSGIPLPDTLRDELDELARSLGVEPLVGAGA